MPKPDWHRTDFFLALRLQIGRLVDVASPRTPISQAPKLLIPHDQHFSRSRFTVVADIDRHRHGPPFSPRPQDGAIERQGVLPGLSGGHDFRFGWFHGPRPRRPRCWVDGLPSFHPRDPNAVATRRGWTVGGHGGRFPGGGQGGPSVARRRTAESGDWLIFRLKDTEIRAHRRPKNVPVPCALDFAVLLSRRGRPLTAASRKYTSVHIGVKPPRQPHGEATHARLHGE